MDKMDVAMKLQQDPAAALQLLGLNDTQQKLVKKALESKDQDPIELLKTKGGLKEDQLKKLELMVFET